MKLLPLLTVVPLMAITVPACAWDGFDADSTDLIEVIPDRLPNRGDTVDVRDYDTDTNATCKVESVRRNRRTVELVVRCAENEKRILVMEGI